MLRWLGVWFFLMLAVPAVADSKPGLNDSIVPDTVMKAHFIYVGHGQATLLEFSCGAVLIDAGGDNSSEALLTQYLDSFFNQRPDLNRTLDLVVLTHRHIDHTRNFARVAELYDVRNLILNGELERGKYKRVSKVLARHPDTRFFGVQAGDIGSEGAWNDIIDPLDCTGTSDGRKAGIDPEIRVLWGAMTQKPPHWKESYFEDENNHSLALLIAAGPARLLFTGDLETQGLLDLVNTWGDYIRSVDLYQISHHGFKSGTAPGFLETIMPRLAILSRDAYRPWKAGIVKRFNRFVTAQRETPLHIPTWRWDKEIYKTLTPEEREWPSPAGRIFEKGRLESAIYWPGREGNIQVTFGAAGEIVVTTRFGIDILGAP